MTSSKGNLPRRIRFVQEKEEDLEEEEEKEDYEQKLEKFEEETNIKKERKHNHLAMKSVGRIEKWCGQMGSGGFAKGFTMKFWW